MYVYRDLILSFIFVILMVACTIIGINEILIQDGNTLIGVLLALSPWISVGCVITRE